MIPLAAHRQRHLAAHRPQRHAAADRTQRHIAALGGDEAEAERKRTGGADAEPERVVRVEDEERGQRGVGEHPDRLGGAGRTSPPIRPGT